MSVLKREIECNPVEESLLQYNRVDYSSLNNARGMVTRRQHQTAFAPHKTYNAETDPNSFQPVILSPVEIEIKVSGADFIDGRSSWLHFNLATNRDGNNKFSYGNGSALNWIKGIKVISADGQTIDNLTQSNLHMTYRDRWSKSSAYFNTSLESVGEIKGYGLLVKDGGFACPLNEIIPLFDYDRLLPSHLINGMRIIFTLAPPHELMTRIDQIGTKPNLSYELSDVRLVLDTYTLDNKIQQMLNKQEMIIEYPSYKTKTISYDGAGLRLPLQYSVARAMFAFVVTQYVSTQTNPEIREKENIKQDQMTGEFVLSLKEYRWRIGNSFNPNVPIKTDVDAFAHCLTVFNKLSTNTGNIAVSPSSFQSTQNCFAVNLKRAGMGTPINSGNELELQLQHKSALRRVAHMFVNYQKQLRIMPIDEQQRMQGYRNKLAILE